MVRLDISCICRGLANCKQVLSSVIAAWADITDALAAGDPAVLVGDDWSFGAVSRVVSRVNVGYFWMMVNCLTSAAYVRKSISLGDVTLTFYFRFCRCGRGSRRQASQIGTRCSTITYYLFPSSSYSLLLRRVGPLQTWRRICEAPVLFACHALFIH